MTTLNTQKLLDMSEEELKKEYRRLHAELINENSAVKNKHDLVISDCMSFIKNLLTDLHGVPAGKLVELDNPEAVK